MKSRVMIGKVGVDRVNKQEVVTYIKSKVQEKTSALIVTPYSEMIVLAEYDSDFERSLIQSDLALPDGIGILWASMFLSHKVSFFPSLMRIPSRHLALYQDFSEQVRGSELIYDICDLADTEIFRVYVLGGRPEVIQAFCTKAEYDYPKMVITGWFDEMITSKTEMTEVFQSVADSHSDIVFLNLSPPLQEKWGARLREFLQSQDRPGVICCFGGSLDMMVGYQRVAPRIIRWFGVEWLWRLIWNPRRIRRMYRAVIQFPLLIRRYKQSSI